MNEDSSEVKIARLEERLEASDKALTLAQTINAASALAVSAHAKANSALIVSLIATVIALVIALFGKR